MVVIKKSLNLLKKEELQKKIYSPISQEFEDSLRYVTWIALHFSATILLTLCLWIRNEKETGCWLSLEAKNRNANRDTLLKPIVFLQNFHLNQRQEIIKFSWTHLKIRVIICFSKLQSWREVLKVSKFSFYKQIYGTQNCLFCLSSLFIFMLFSFYVILRLCCLHLRK